MAKKGSKKVWEASIEEIKAAMMKFGLMAVKGPTGHAGLIYAKKHKTRGGGTSSGFDSTRHTKCKVSELIAAAHAKGDVVVTDGKYVRIWTSGYFMTQGGSTKVKKHTRKAPRMDQLKEEASGMKLKKWTLKKTKKSLAASIRRKKSGKHVSSKKHHPKSLKKTGKKGGKFSALMEAPDEE